MRRRTGAGESGRMKRRTLLRDTDDRQWLWLAVGLHLAGWGGGMVLDALTPLDLAAAFYRMATWPFALLPPVGLGLGLLSGAGAVALTFTGWVPQPVGFRLRVYALCWYAVVICWYGAAGFVYGVMQASVVLGLTLAAWRWQPRGEG